jgi:hypothetical protein
MANLFEYSDIVIVENDDGSTSYIPKDLENTDYKAIKKLEDTNELPTKYDVKATDKIKKGGSEFVKDKGKGK